MLPLSFPFLKTGWLTCNWPDCARAKTLRVVSAMKSSAEKVSLSQTLRWTVPSVPGGMAKLSPQTGFFPALWWTFVLNSLPPIKTLQ